MKTVSIRKAQPTISDIESMTIIINDEIPTLETLEKSRQFYIDQGKDLAEALCLALPGGTLDQLICELLTRKASLFRVPMFNKKEE